jgi:hypothetical protein
VSSTAANPKSKTAAILLAVFLGFWTWLYTYKKDGWKFWVSLALTLTGMIVMAYTTINMITSRDELAISSEPVTAWFSAWIIAYIITGALWIWGIIDTATKKAVWFEKYPD